METKDLYFDLPEELIAQYPTKKRGDDRLLVVNKKSGEHQDMFFRDLPKILKPGSLLVLNESKVRKARVYAQNKTGGTVEMLFLNPNSDSSWDVTCNRLKKRKVGEILKAGNIEFEIREILENGIVKVVPASKISENFFDNNGHVPLPPYIKREDEVEDEDTYQTVFAKDLGSVASPTSGLHYTNEILDEIKSNEIELAFITLHVGMGTFLPIRATNLKEHVMHSENYYISEESANKINKYLQDNKTIIASGTTSLRCLESAYDMKNKCIIAGSSSTDIFITPGYEFKVVNELITNFHTPYSTLMALVSAFSSLKIVKEVYKYAVEKKYRFFSYGDSTYWH